MGLNDELNSIMAGHDDDHDVGHDDYEDGHGHDHDHESDDANYHYVDFHHPNFEILTIVFLSAYHDFIVKNKNCITPLSIFDWTFNIDRFAFCLLNISFLL